MSRCLAPLSVADRRGTGMARSRTLLTGRWRRAAAVATILSVLVLGSQPLVSQGSTAVPAGFAAASVSSRADSLLRRVTLAEKVGQMDQIVIGKLKAASAPGNGDCNGGNNDPLQPACLEKVLITNKTGSILAGGTDNPKDNTGKGWAEPYNTVQRYAIDHSPRRPGLEPRTTGGVVEGRVRKHRAENELGSDLDGERLGRSHNNTRER